MARRWPKTLLLAPLVALLGFGGPLTAQPRDGDDFANPVERLRDRLARGEVTLTYAEDGHGYLESLLDALDIPLESQVLPFTRSSLLAGLIAPDRPRALYFNDDVAVGVAVGGSGFELIANDRSGGPVFYTFAARRRDNPRPAAEISGCTFCHNRADATASLWIVADIAAGAGGEPLRQPRSDPSFDLTDHGTAFEKRWGGWYVTGTTGRMRHHGNAILAPGARELPIDSGLNVTDLTGRFDPKLVLAPGSDVVALMTLEHQAGFSNRAAALVGAYSEEKLEELAAYMTFAGEIPLPEPVRGSSAFRQIFAARPPRDPQGRSLRDFDLQTRLFRHPLSYMIYSTAFDSLPAAAKTRLWEKLQARLRQSPAGRDAMAIVAATKPDAPDTWKQP